MKHRDDHMDDFFRKRLDRFDESVESWEKPDPGAWQAAASQVSQFGPSSVWAWPQLIAASATVLLLASVAYVFYLRQEVSVLEETVLTQRVHIEQVEQRLQALENQHSNELSTLQAAGQAAQAPTNTQPRSNQASVVSRPPGSALAAGTKVPEPVRLAGQYTQTPVNHQPTAPPIPPVSGRSPSAAPSAQPRNTATGPIGQRDSAANAAARYPIYPVMITAAGEELPFATEAAADPIAWMHVRPDAQSQGAPEKKIALTLPKINLAGVQVGYELRGQAQQLRHPQNMMILGADPFEILAEGYPTPMQNTTFHGLTLGVPLTQKWTLQTGLRHSQTPIRSDQFGFTEHSPESGDLFELPDGNLGQQVFILQAGPLMQGFAEGMLQFSPALFEEEDVVLAWESYLTQAQRAWQIPLGLSYQIGNGEKWQYLVGFGGQWNRVTLKDASTELIAYSLTDIEEESFVLVSSSSLIFEESPIDYLSAYASVGVQYQLHPNWSIRGEATYNEHFAPVELGAAWERRDASLSLGLRYHF